MATSDKLKEKLLSALKKHSPYRVVAFTGDEDGRTIAVPQRRRRWATVIEAIEARPWSRVELHDKAGSILGYVENNEASADIEDLGDGGRMLRTRSEAEWIVQLVAKSVREDRSHRNEEITAVLQAQGSFVREMGGAVHALTRIYQEQRDAAAETAEMKALADNSGGTVKELLEAAPQILQVLPYIREMMNGKGKH